MVTSTEAFDILKSIGLNLYERKIFVALLAKGVATAAEVSEIAGVPRSRSYDVLESLADKGFVVVQPSKPIKYVALPPAEAMERTKQNLEKNHKIMIERINKVKVSPIMDELEKLHKDGLNLVKPSDMTGTLKGRDTINRQLRFVFKDAKESISIVTTEKGLSDLYSNHFRVLKKAAGNGIKLRIMAPLRNENVVNALSGIAELKNIGNPMGRFCVIDNEQMVFSLTDDENVHETQDVAFWADSAHAVKNMMGPYFSMVWGHGKKESE